MKLTPGMKFDLQRMRKWMAALGDPQDQYLSIHVAGTNGKGSVTATMAQILIESGLRVGMYTSPHLEKVNERFRVNNKCISDQEFTHLAKKIKKVLVRPTEFEFLTALGFVWFAKQQVDVLVLEVGLGGRLDATNVVRHVLASVITNIELEHTEWLGKTVSKIAAEKAGIIKTNVPVFTMASGQALKVIAEKARSRNAPLTVVTAQSTRYPTALQGSHQQRNAALAVETIRRTAEFIPKWRPSAVHQGLRNVRWPGRFEIWKGKRTVILDGAHNPASIRVLIATLREKKIKKVNLIFGVLKNKDHATMIRLLAPLVEKGFVVPVPVSESSNPVALAKTSAWKRKMAPEKNWQTALSRLECSSDKTPILVTGSLYLIGAVKRKTL